MDTKSYNYSKVEEGIALSTSFHVDAKTLLQKKLNNTIQKYLDIPDVEDININKPGEVFYELSGGRRFREEDPKLTKAALLDLAHYIASFNGKDWHPFNAPLDARLHDGTRVNVMATPSVSNALAISFRKRKPDAYQLKDFGVSPEDQKILLEAARTRKNIIISGGTSTGKTSFLEILCREIPMETRIITIQDPQEIIFHQPNHVPFDVNASGGDAKEKELSQIAEAALRQNPDCIIFGEIRERRFAAAYKQASNTGHDGCMSTIHANDPKSCIDRLTNLVHAHEKGDKEAIREELLKTIDIVVQLRKGMNGTRTAEIKYF